MTTSPLKPVVTDRTAPLMTDAGPVAPFVPVEAGRTGRAAPELTPGPAQ